jgi:hypothetical protein
VVKFSEFNSFDFMVGFNRKFVAETGRIEVSVDKYVDGVKVQSIPVEVDVCSDLHPGVKTTDQEFGTKIFYDYSLYCPINVDSI